MALITCPECGHKVSDQATSCPSCGYPLEVMPTQAPFVPTAGGRRPVQTVEQTGKRFKAYMAGGVVAMLTGLTLTMAGEVTVGAVLMMLGLAVYIAARSGAWWHHG